MAWCSTTEPCVNPGVTEVRFTTTHIALFYGEDEYT